MSGETITGRVGRYGIQLSNPATQNPLIVTATGGVDSYVIGVSGEIGYTWTVENQGAISGKYFGILLSSATIINGAPGQPNAVIYAGSGVYGSNIYGPGNAAIRVSQGSVTNYGWIDSKAGNGIDLGTGSIANKGLITSGGGPAIATRGAATVTNSGTIEGYSGVVLGSGGTLINAGIIASDKSGIVGNGDAVVLNGNDRLVIEPGSFINGGVVVAGSNNALELAAPTGTINAQGFNAITIDAGANWTLTGSDTGVAIDGSGTITNTGTLAGAVVARLEAGGGFTNAAGAVIDGSVYGVATAHNVTNLGTIIGYSNGVGLGVGGTFSNGSATDSTAFVSGYYGVLVDRAAGTVANYGTIVGRSTGGVALEDGGVVTNGASADATGSITGQRFGVGVFGAAGTVTNFATIAGTGSGAAGIKLEAGGTVANQAGALISGVYAVDVFGGGGSISNAGRIGTGGGTEEGIFLAQGGSVANVAGASIAAMYGVLSDASATLTNGGTISGTQEGVVIEGTGWVTNGAVGAPSASISGTKSGVQIGAGSTIVNFGKISASAGPAITTYGSYAVDVTVVNAGTISGTGGTAIDLAGIGANRVVDDPGAVFKGNVVAQGTGNTLELAAGSKAGSISGLGSSFAGFNTVAVDPSASWALSGHDTVGPNAFIVTGPGGTLNVTGSVQAGSGLDLSSSGTIAVGATGALEVGTAGGTKGGSITVDAGATLTVAGTFKAAVVDQGSLTFDGNTTISGSLAGSGSAAIDPGTVLDVSGQLGLASISFLGDSTTLEFGTPSSASSTISGFGNGDSIDLLHAVGTSDTFADNMLTVSGAKGVVASLDFTPGLNAGNFALASDHHGGTMIGFVPS